MTSVSNYSVVAEHFLLSLPFKERHQTNACSIVHIRDNTSGHVFESAVKRACGLPVCT